MALVSNIQLQPGAVGPPQISTNLKYTVAGLTATDALAVGVVPVSTSGSITVKSANDVRNWFQTTKSDGNVEIYMSNDARPDWALRVAGTADNSFVIANSYGSNCTAQFPAFSIGGAGAVGIGKTGATNTLDIAYKNAASGGIQLTETQNNVGIKAIAESASGSIGTSSNHKLGFRVNNTTVAAFNTSTQFGIGTDSPGATLDVRGGAIFNEAGAAVDFRIEGDAEQNLFFVDGSADAIGMGTATPVDTSRLHIMGTDGDPSATHNADAMLIVENNGNSVIEIATSNTTYGGIGFSDAGAHSRGAVIYDHGTGLGGLADTLMFQSAGSIGMVMDSGGEVGIGTLQPSAMLHVVGGSDAAIRLQGSDTGSPALNFYQGTTCRATVTYQDTNDVFAIDSAGTLQLQTASTTKLTVGNCVGIGTTAPVDACNSQLDIYSTAATTALQLRTGNSSAAGAGIRGEGYRNDGDAEQVLQVVGRNAKNTIDLGIFEVSAEAKHCTGALEFKTFDGSSMTQKMIINSAGNVGVGTATPAGKLHVEGSCAVFNPVSANAGVLQIVGGSTHADSVRLNASGTTNMYLEYRGYLGHQFVVDSTERMRLTSTGLGIGTTAPSGLGASSVNIFAGSSAASDLTLESNSGANFAVFFQGATTNFPASIYSCGGFQFATACDKNANAFTEHMRICANGNVGIGTAAPAEKLHVHGGVTIQGSGILCVGSPHFKVTSDGVVTWGDGVDNGVLTWDTGKAVVGGQSSHALQLNAGGSHAVTIDTSGLVAIGSTSPSSYSTSADDFVIAKDAAAVGMSIRSSSTGTGNIFFVNNEASNANNGVVIYNHNTGEFSFDNYASGCHYTFNLANNEVMRINNNGIGIGTTTPAAPLQVCGNTVLNTTFVEGKLTVQDGNYGAAGEARSDVSYGTIALMGCSPATGCVLPITFNMTGAGGRSRAAIAGVDLGSVGYCMGLAFYTRGAADGTAITTADEKMRILHNGNVGIGTTAGGAKLHVRGANENTFAVPTTMLVQGTDSYNSGTAGGGIGFMAEFNSGTSSTQIATIGGEKENTTDGDYGGKLTFHTRENGNVGVLRMSLGSSGKLRLGDSAALICGPRGNVFYEGGHSAQLQIEGTTPTNSGMALIRANAQYGPNIILARTCGAVGTNTLVAANQALGSITFQANDGTDFVQAAFIAARTGNHAASNCMSGEIHFGTSDGTNGSVTERMRIAEDGNVGIGTTAPDSLLHLESSGFATAKLQIESTHASCGYPTLAFKNDATTWTIYAPNGGSTTSPDAFQIQNAGGANFLIETDGKVGISTAKPSTFSSSNAVLAIGNTSLANTELVLASASSGGSVGQISFTCSNNTTNQARIYYNQANSHMGFEVNQGYSFGIGSNTAVVDIDANGFIRQVNCSSTAYFLQFDAKVSASDNNTVFFMKADDCVATRMYNYSDGDFANHDGVYGTISDCQYKQDITDVRDYWDDFKALRYRKFRHKTDVAANPNAPYRLGLVAQEVESVFPALVPESEDSNPNSSVCTHKWVKSSVIEGPIMASVLQKVLIRLEAAESKILSLEAAA